MKIVIFLGAPGVGKGTLAAVLAKRTGAQHVSTGAMLREAVQRKTPAGVSAKGYMDRGELVPDGVLVEMMDEFLAETPQGAMLFFDGFPRTVPQAEALDALARKFKSAVSCVICLEAAESVILDRLGGRRVCPKCGAGFHVRNVPPKQAGVCDACQSPLVIRSDDRPETIKNRLAVYAEQTAPLVAWYERQGVLKRIDASPETEIIADAVAHIVRHG
ncbi:MAG: adenylate kinase [Kiritimatiellaeota bacterium]|nr:adenylate kinase [Kiritimatiellota bacterium]